MDPDYQRNYWQTHLWAALVQFGEQHVRFQLFWSPGRLASRPAGEKVVELFSAAELLSCGEFEQESGSEKQNEFMRTIDGCGAKQPERSLRLSNWHLHFMDCNCRVGLV